MRLIDADALFDKLFHAWGTEIDAGAVSEFMGMLNDAPTITPPPNASLTLEEAGKSAMLKTTWETPETCPHCMEHLSREWSFCPECGRPTDWSENAPLTLEELHEMGGEPYWHVGLQDNSQPPHWSILDPFFAKHIEDYGYGVRWLAYRRKPERSDTNA